MSLNIEELNLIVAERLGSFVKGRLLQNKAYLDNSGESISTDEVLQQAESLKKRYVFDYIMAYSKEFGEFVNRSAGSINFTNDEIDEIAELIQKSVETVGIGHNATYWDVISFASDRLEKLANYKYQRLGELAKTDEDYNKIVKYKKCLQLDKMPLHYKPFACIIACGYPYSALRIANDNNETIYDVSNSGEVRVDDLLQDMFLGDEGIAMPSVNGSNEEAIDVAVNWWAQAITDPTFALRYVPSVSYLSSVLALSNMMQKSAPSEEAMETFKESLAEEIRIGLALNGHYEISADCNLDPVLKSALEKSRLRDVDYTWDTSMNISKEEVSISFGRGNKQVIYDANKNVKTDGIQKVKV